MICKECGAEMFIEDKDYNFKGNYDNYWQCPECLTSCVEKVRYGQTWMEQWHSENLGAKDCIINHRITRRKNG